MCPKWSGLLVFGEEYSTITVSFLEGVESKFCSVSENSCKKAESLTFKFKKPFTIPKFSMNSIWFLISSPSSFPRTSGLFFANFTSGKITIVKSPSNSVLFFWTSSVTFSMPYNLETISDILDCICCLIVIIKY